MSLIKNKDISQEEGLTGSGFVEDIDDDMILRQFKENERYLDIIQNYIAVLQMKSNLVRTRTELKNINTKRYQDDLTAETLKDMFNKCDKYYKDIERFFDKSSVTYDTELSEHMYHVCLRFMSSSYITKGHSSNRLVNPRYFLQGRDVVG